mgnify:CR=1 FL=1
MLLAAFLESAAAHAGQEASYAYAADSFYLPSPLEQYLGLAAPAIYVSFNRGASWDRCAAGLETPAWSHAPLIPLEPGTDADGKPAPPSVAAVREALETCAFGRAQPHGDEL